MPRAQRQGDINSAGGRALSGVQSVRVNGRPVVVQGIKVTSHPPCGRPGGSRHCNAQTKGGSGSVRAGGRQIIRTNDIDSCGHPRIGGSPNVRVA